MSHNIWKSFQIKIVLILLFVVSSITVGVYFINFNQYYNLVIDDLKEDAKSVHKYAEKSIDEQIFHTINTPEDKDIVLYQSTYYRLNEIRQIANVKYLFTAKLNEDNQFVYVVDAWDMDDEHFVDVGELVEDEFTELLFRCVFNNEVAFSDKIVDTEYGMLYMAYFPYCDSEGNVLGVIGIDFDCEYLYNSIKNVRLTTILFSVAFALMFVLVLVYLVRREFSYTQSVINDMEEEVNKVKERSMLMLDTSPVCAQIFDKDFNTIDCNEAAVKLYGFNDKSEYQEKFLEFCSPEFQPCGESSRTKAIRLVSEALKVGYIKFDWLHQKPCDKTPIPAEITLIRVEYDDDFVVIGYTRDLRMHKMLMEKIEHRNKLLQIVDDMSVILYEANTQTFEKAMHESMGIVAKAIGVESVNLWKNHTSDGELYCTQIFDCSSEVEGFVDGVPFKYDEFIAEWRETLAEGKHINSIVTDLSPETQS